MKTALVGFGKMGKIYHRLLSPSYVVDPNIDTGPGWFRSVDDFIERRLPVDLVICAAPTDLHFEIGLKLLFARYDVLMEKPLCLRSEEARQLELLAAANGGVLYQSTPERYNPVVKFLMRNLSPGDIESVESTRSGVRPEKAREGDALFDLGIHDVDLWFHLGRRSVPWRVIARYGEPKREMRVRLRDGRELDCDLMRKTIRCGDSVLDLSSSDANNPLLEMLYDIVLAGSRKNEAWSEEIKILESVNGPCFDLPLERLEVSRSEFREHAGGFAASA